MEFRIVPLCGLCGGLLVSAMGCASAPAEADLGENRVASASMNVRGDSRVAGAAAPGPHFRRATPDEVATHMARIGAARENARRREEAMESLLRRLSEGPDPEAKSMLIAEYTRLVEDQNPVAKEEALERLAAAARTK